MTGRACKVYFIFCEGGRGPGFVKIGMAVDTRRRLGELQIGNPYPLSLVATAEGGRELEREYHRRFAHLAVSGEWCRWAPEIAAEVDRLNRITFGVPPEGDLAALLKERLEREALA